MLQSVLKFPTSEEESHIACTFSESVISNCHGCNLQQAIVGRSVNVQTDPVAGLVLCPVGTGSSFPRITVAVPWPQQLKRTY